MPHYTILSFDLTTIHIEPQEEETVFGLATEAIHSPTTCLTFQHSKLQTPTSDSSMSEDNYLPGGSRQSSARAPSDAELMDTLKRVAEQYHELDSASQARDHRESSSNSAPLESEVSVLHSFGLTPKKPKNKFTLDFDKTHHDLIYHKRRSGIEPHTPMELHKPSSESRPVSAQSAVEAWVSSTAPLKCPRGDACGFNCDHSRNARSEQASNAGSIDVAQNHDEKVINGIPVFGHAQGGDRSTSLASRPASRLSAAESATSSKASVTYSQGWNSFRQVGGWPVQGFSPGISAPTSAQVKNGGSDFWGGDGNMSSQWDEIVLHANGNKSRSNLRGATVEAESEASASASRAGSVPWKPAYDNRPMHYSQRHMSPGNMWESRNGPLNSGSWSRDKTAFVEWTIQNYGYETDCSGNYYGRPAPKPGSYNGVWGVPEEAPAARAWRTATVPEDGIQTRGWGKTSHEDNYNENDAWPENDYRCNCCYDSGYMQVSWDGEKRPCWDCSLGEPATSTHRPAKTRRERAMLDQDKIRDLERKVEEQRELLSEYEERDYNAARNAPITDHLNPTTTSEQYDYLRPFGQAAGLRKEVQFLYQRLASGDLSPENRKKTIGVLRIIEGEPTQAPPMSPVPEKIATKKSTTFNASSSAHDHGSSSNVAMDMKIHDLTKDITKMRAFDKFQRMQEDSERLARIEEQLAKLKDKPKDSDKVSSFAKRTAREVQKLNKRLDELFNKHNGTDQDKQNEICGLRYAVKVLEKQCHNADQDIGDLNRRVYYHEAKAGNSGVKATSNTSATHEAPWKSNELFERSDWSTRSSGHRNTTSEYRSESTGKGQPLLPRNDTVQIPAASGEDWKNEWSPPHFCAGCGYSYFLKSTLNCPYCGVHYKIQGSMFPSQDERGLQSTPRPIHTHAAQRSRDDCQGCYVERKGWERCSVHAGKDSWSEVSVPGCANTVPSSVNDDCDPVGRFKKPKSSPGMVTPGSSWDDLGDSSVKSHKYAKSDRAESVDRGWASRRSYDCGGSENDG